MDHEIKRVERIPSEKKETEFVELTVKKEEPQVREFPQTVPAGKPAVIAVVKGRKIEVEIYAGVELPVVETICQVLRVVPSGVGHRPAAGGDRGSPVG